MADAKIDAFKFVITMVEWSEEIVNQFEELGPTAGNIARKLWKILEPKRWSLLESE